jgi:DNA-binding NarL/FixJ family response regulator
MTRIRVALAAGHEVVRLGLRVSLEAEPDFEVAGEATSGETAVVLARETEPDVMLLDVELGEGGMSSPEACRGILAASPRTAVLVLANGRQDGRARRSLAAGARTCLAKEVALAELKRVVRDLGQAGAPTDRAPLDRQTAGGAGAPTDAPRRAAGAGARDRAPRLSDMDLAIIRLLAQGLSNKEIGAHVGLSPHTVKDHLKKIASSFSVRSRTEIVVHALHRGLV